MASVKSIRKLSTIASAILFMSACGGPSDPMSVEKPSYIEFAAPLKAVEQKLLSKCDTVESYIIDPPQFASIEEQAQIDCTGLEFFGAKREAEFVFVDGALAIAHINISPGEVPAVENAFIQTFGTPTYSKDTVLAFKLQNAAVRNDPAQVTYFAAFAAGSLMDSVSIRPDR